MKALKASKAFQVGENDIAYISPDFQSDFYAMDIKPSKRKLTATKLGKSMASEQIQKELNPGGVTLGELYNAMKSGRMDKEVYGYLAYVKNKEGVPRLVDVYWRDGQGWDLYTFSVDDAYDWDADRRVFSGLQLESNNVKMVEKTEDRIKSLEDFRMKVEAILKL